MKLPPPQHCLTNVNFSLVPNPPPQDSSEEDAPGEDEDEQDLEEVDGAVANGEHQSQAAEEAGGDEEMTDAAIDTEHRGTKRSLDEDEEYD